MVTENSNRKLYIVISQTGTVLSRLLKFITKAEYNHVSLGLSEDLQSMYSFGRKRPRNPFLAGFVLESPNFGTFKHFSNTEVKVLSLDISDEKYNVISKRIEYMLSHKKEFGYNYWGLWLAIFKIHIKPQNRYFCSEFVKDILLNIEIDGSEKLEKIPKPIDFLEIPNLDLVYCGKLCEYTVK